MTLNRRHAMRKPPQSKSTAAQAVGYGKPPKDTQFKPGQSGNRKGRPKGSLNIATILARTLREQVAVNEGGRRRSISKLEAAVKQIVNKAATGDAAAIRFLIGLTQMVETQFEPQGPPAELPENDRKVMASLLARIQNVSVGGNHEKS